MCRVAAFLSVFAWALIGASPAGEKLKGIACRSVHLWYPAAVGTAFYNELTVYKSADGTFFMVCGWSKGYFGIQELANGKKLVIFSVWEAAAGDTEEAEVAGCVNLRRLAEVCFKYDPNSLIHGVFLEKIAGRLRHPRALSAFIEARGARPADSGGVKFDRILPKPSVAGLGAEAGYGNVPFHRREFTAEAITAYFTLDLAQLRGYGLGDHATDLLIALSLWKIRRFLETGLRLRTACDLELVGEPVVKQPTGFQLPTTAALTAALKQLIQACQAKFAKPPVTELTWTAEAKKSGKKAGAEKPAD